MNLSIFGQNKSIFFICLVIFYFVLFSCIYILNLNNSLLMFIWVILFFLSMLFSGSVYGFCTKDKYGAIALGFSFPFILGIFNFIDGIGRTIDSAVPYSEACLALISYNFPFVLMGILCACAGGFLSANEITKSKRIIYYFVAVMFLMVAAYLFIDPPYYLLFPLFGL